MVQGQARHVSKRNAARSVLCTHTIQQHEPLVIENALDDPRFANAPLIVGSPYVRSYAGVPLRTPEGYNVGALCAMDTRSRRFSPADIAILSNFANIVRDEPELRLIAQADHLTGALTRRGFVDQAGKEIERARRYERATSLVMLDVDHFKRGNDTYGHAIGDQALHSIARIAEGTLRPSDLFGRLGGEEFALLLPETNGAAAVIAAERRRREIAKHPLMLLDGSALRITASFGVAELSTSTSSLAAWLARADTMLYAARSGERDCTKFAQNT